MQSHDQSVRLTALDHLLCTTGVHLLESARKFGVTPDQILDDLLVLRHRNGILHRRPRENGGGETYHYLYVDMDHCEDENGHPSNVCCEPVR